MALIKLNVKSKVMKFAVFTSQYNITLKRVINSVNIN